MMQKVGPLLAYWRGQRRMSQLSLANEANVSPRHVSFIESGRSNPSRDMVLLLANVLDVPLRERNTLLTAAGFAAHYTESKMEEPELVLVRKAIDAILEKHEPLPAVVIDRGWNLTRMNRGAEKLFTFLLAGQTPPGPPNVLRFALHPSGLRPWVENWEEIAPALIQRAHREAVGHAVDAGLRTLLAEVMTYPGVAECWKRVDLSRSVLPVIPMRFARDGQRFAYFSTVTTLGTPTDVTAQEVRLECFFPAE
jgi:transcriptional regulator with XRE-family HTH domain